MSTSQQICSSCGKSFSGLSNTCPECTETEVKLLPEIPGYEIVSLIGSGGMGEVYLARDLSLGRQVAIKFLSKKILDDETAHTRFLREARTMATVEHPNVVRIYSFGEANDRAYLVMEYVEGKTLAGLIHEKGKLDVKEALRILEQTAEGLEAASEKQIVHRDIKPHNILIHSKGRICIGDFGLAKATSTNDPEYQTVTQAGTIFGSPAYISPEQAKGQTPDFRSDLYSLGIVFYEMLTGQRPFVGSVVEVLSNHIHTPLPLLPDKNSKIQKLLNHLTEKDPAKRPQSYTEVLNLIRSCRSESKGKKKLIPTIGIVALIVVIVLLGYYVWRRLATVDSGSPSQPLKQLQVTFTGNAHYPTISPDGKWIAFMDKSNSIFVQRLGGGEPLKLFQNAFYYSPIKWSPDGSQLAVFGSAGDKKVAIHIVPVTGGEPRQTGVRGPCFCWRPDGSEIVGTDMVGTDVSILKVATGELKVIKVLKIDKESFVQELYCLPDGELMGTILSRKGTSLYRLGLDGKMTEIVPHDKFLFSVLTPDGTKFYFLGGDSAVNIYELAATDLLKGKNPKFHSVLSYEENINLVSVSNNGVFAFDKTIRQSNLWLTRLNTSRTEWTVSPFTSGTWSVEDPAISPDGTQVAICVSKEGSDLYTMSIEGGSMKQLTFSGSGCRNPSWSPDGNRIVFLSRVNGALYMTIVPSNGGPVKVFKEKQVSFTGHMTWAPGTNIIYQSMGNRQYYFLNPDTNKTKTLFPDKGFYGWWFYPLYSPDGSKLVFNGNWPPRSGLWIIDLNNRNPKFLSESEIDGFGWSKDGKWIYGIADENNQLYRVDVSTGQSEKLPQLKIDSEYRISSMDIAPDETTFVIQGTKTQSDIWIADDKN